MKEIAELLEKLSKDAFDFCSKTACGVITTALGYFLPIKDLVNLVVIFFIIDVVFGYWAARKTEGAKFDGKIIWKTTMPRMLISILSISMTYSWDHTFHQDWLPTYNIIGWFISGLLIYSIFKNAYRITKWEAIPQIGNLVKNKFDEATNTKENDHENS